MDARINLKLRTPKPTLQNAKRGETVECTSSNAILDSTEQHAKTGVLAKEEGTDTKRDMEQFGRKRALSMNIKEEKEEKVSKKKLTMQILTDDNEQNATKFVNQEEEDSENKGIRSESESESKKDRDLK